MIDEGWIMIYMDDILIASETLELDKERTKRVLQQLWENNLYLKIEKCKFGAKEVDFLGMKIRHNEIAMDPIKLAGIQDWPTPSKVKDVQSFLGFGNFYRRFIHHYADIAKPLNKLTKKDIEWNWTDRCQWAFDDLKKRFASAPVLQMPDPTKHL